MVKEQRLYMKAHRENREREKGQQKHNVHIVGEAYYCMCVFLLESPKTFLTTQLCGVITDLYPVLNEEMIESRGHL